MTNIRYKIYPLNWYQLKYWTKPILHKDVWDMLWGELHYPMIDIFHELRIKFY